MDCDAKFRDRLPYALLHTPAIAAFHARRCNVNNGDQFCSACGHFLGDARTRVSKKAIEKTCATCGCLNVQEITSAMAKPAVVTVAESSTNSKRPKKRSHLQMLLARSRGAENQAQNDLATFLESVKV